MKPLLALKLRIRNNPLLFRTFWTRHERPYWKRRVVRPGDAAVIEGYPRSANTFATYAFLASQEPGIKFGNHNHSPAQFLLARRYQIPAMLVLRNPLDAALSLMIFDGAMSAEEALLRYIAFHRPLLPIADSFVVAPFEEVTTDFGRTIERLNARFGTNFAPIHHDEAFAKTVIDQIADNRAKRIELYPHLLTANPLKTTTPTPEKEKRRKQLVAAFDHPSLDGLKATARGQYERLMALP